MSDTVTYTLLDGEVELTVELWTEAEGKKNHARLLVDGEEVDAGAAYEIGDVRLGQDAGHPTKVPWWWTGRAYAVALVEEGLAEERHRTVPYAPPPGTRAARWHAWGEQHPRLWASRHVLVWAAGFLGVSALVNALFRWVSFDWLPAVPSLPDLPDAPWPAAPQWWTSFWTWFGDTLTRVIELLTGWLPDGPWGKAVIGLLVALAVAVSEVRRRERRRPAAPDRRDDPDDPNDGA